MKKGEGQRSKEVQPGAGRVVCEKALGGGTAVAAAERAREGQTGRPWGPQRAAPPNTGPQAPHHTTKAPGQAAHTSHSSCSSVGSHHAVDRGGSPRRP